MNWKFTIILIAIHLVVLIGIVLISLKKENKQEAK